jgi:hypothetical protein
LRRIIHEELEKMAVHTFYLVLTLWLGRQGKIPKSGLGRDRMSNIVLENNVQNWKKSNPQILPTRVYSATRFSDDQATPIPSNSSDDLYGDDIFN